MRTWPGSSGSSGTDLARERVLQADAHARRPQRRDGAGRDRAARTLVAGQVAGGRLHVDGAGLEAQDARRSRRAWRRAATPSFGRAPMTDDVDACRARGRRRRAGRRPRAGAPSLAMPRGRPRVGREQPAEVALARGAQQRVGDGVQHDVTVRVTGQPRRARDLDPAQAQARAGAERMAVVAEADAHGCGDERLFDPAQVVGERHLEVRGFTGDRMDTNGTGLEQRGLIGELAGSVRREGAPTRRGGARAARPAGVWAAASVERSTVSSTRPSPTRLSVSATGRTGRAAPCALDRLDHGGHERRARRAAGRRRGRGPAGRDRRDRGRRGGARRPPRTAGGSRRRRRRPSRRAGSHGGRPPRRPRDRAP